MSLLDRLHTNASDIGVFAGLAVVFSTLKWITAPKQGSLKVFIVNLAVAIPIGILAGGTSLELGYGDFVSMTVASFATFLSRDFLDLLRDKQLLSDLTKRAADNIVDKVTK